MKKKKPSKMRKITIFVTEERLEMECWPGEITIERLHEPGINIDISKQVGC